jgi:hypothetical protein
MKRILFAVTGIAHALAGSKDLPEALYPPSGCATAQPLLLVPDAVAPAMRAMSDAGVHALAERLDKEKVSPDFEVDDYVFLLDALRTLATKTPAGEHVYLLAD